MTESEEVSGRKRRSSAEIQRLVTEFQSSGLRQNEFCRNHGLALSSLQRQLKKRSRDQGEVKEGSGLVAVELAGKERAGKDRSSRSSSALEIVLCGGRRIEVRPGFDSKTLEQLLGVLERA